MAKGAACFDFHVHTMYSPDSILQPEKIIKIATKIGLSGVAVTDHNTIKGALKTKALVKERKLNFKVIIGSEIKTNYGDIIGLFLNDEITSNNFIEVYDKIREQDGIVVLPHPYKRNINPNKLLKYVDLIEVLNARIPKKLNHKAQKLAKETKTKPIAGSDAHMGFEIGYAQTILETYASASDDDIRKCLLKGYAKIVGSELPFHLRMLSVGVGKYKKEGLIGLIKAGCKKVLR